MRCAAAADANANAIADAIAIALASAIATCQSQDRSTDITALSDFVGHKLFIRTVTYHFVGKVKAVTGNLMELSEASWVADSGRFHQAIKNGTLDEVEPVGRCWVNINAVTDMFPWEHPLPERAK
jgi:hypothetical protein